MSGSKRRTNAAGGAEARLRELAQLTNDTPDGPQRRRVRRAYLRAKKEWEASQQGGLKGGVSAPEEGVEREMDR
jgi:hypothetical protein